MSDVSKLKEIGLFSGFDDATLRCLAPALEKQHFKDRQIIFKEGDPGAEMYFIYSGEVEIIKQAGRGSEGARILSVLGKSEFLGEMALIDKERRSATAKARGDVVLFRLSCREFENFMNTDTRIVICLLKGLLSTMVKRLREMDVGFVTIHETGRLLASQQNIPLLLDGVLMKILEIVKSSERGFIALWNEFNEVFDIQIQKGFTDKDMTLPKNDPVIRWLKEHREVLVMADTSPTSLFARNVLPHYYGRSFILLPLVHRDELLGFVLISNASKKMDVQRSETNLLSGIASQIAPVLANAKKIAEDENRRRLQQAKARYGN
jgi:CRP-like cAMP-binding protein